MKVTKTSNLSSRDNNITPYDRALDADIASIFNVLKGRVRFGTGTDGARGENISGEFQVFTTSATPDAENTIAHTIGAVPIGYIVLKQDKAGSLYDSGTTWTSTNLYLKCDVASVAFTIFLLK